jgi:hypothetical protein
MFVPLAEKEGHGPLHGENISQAYPLTYAFDTCDSLYLLPSTYTLHHTIQAVRQPTIYWILGHHGKLATSPDHPGAGSMEQI